MVHDGFDAEAVAAAAQRRRDAGVAGADRVAAHRPELCSAASCSADRVHPTACADNVVTTYGMTETGSGVVYDGRPLDGVEVRVDSDDEIHLRCPMLLRCYRDGSVPLRRRLVRRRATSASIDDDGLLTVHGRRGDMIITGGENVWPAVVEVGASRAHPSVAEVAVAGVPDDEWGAACRRLDRARRRRRIRRP